MIEILNRKYYAKCSYCGAILKYDEEDVSTREKSYGVATYQGETYIAREITCPNCNHTLEVM